MVLPGGRYIISAVQFGPSTGGIVPPNLLYYRRKSELHDKTEETLNRLQGVHFVIGEALRINFVKQVA